MTELESNIIKHYTESDCTNEFLKEKFNISQYELYKILKGNNIKHKIRKTPRDIELQVLDLYTNQNLNTTEISKKIHISKAVAILILKRNGIKMFGTKKRPDIEIKVVELYKQNTISSTAEKLSILPETVAQILKRNNIDIRKKRNIEKEKEIIEYYSNNIVSLKEVGIKFDLSLQTISNILQRNNMKIRKNVQIRLRLSDDDYKNYLDKLPDFEKYKRKITSLSKKKQVSFLQNYHLKGKAGIDGAYQIDHKYSILEGFKNNIPIEIISHVENLEMIPWRDNLSKQEQCSITLEELINKIKKHENKTS